MSSCPRLLPLGGNGPDIPARVARSACRNDIVIVLKYCPQMLSFPLSSSSSPSNLPTSILSFQRLDSSERGLSFSFISVVLVFLFL